MEKKKILIFATLTSALAVFGVASICSLIEKPPEFNLQAVNTTLSMGKNSAIEIVLIEDFQCRNCMAFSHKVIPRIKSEYVETGRARFTLVPVGFLAGSQMIANAVLEVQRQAPNRLFSFLEAVLDQYEGEDLRMQDLIRLAKRTGGIDLAQLQRSMETQGHKEILTKNLTWAQTLMGARFRTPALYINGLPGSTYSFEAIQYQIDQTVGKQ